jgi:hypothetical protein
MGSLQEDWLAKEFQTIDAEIDGWSDGLKESFQSLFAEADAKTIGLATNSARGEPTDN